MASEPSVIALRHGTSADLDAVIAIMDAAFEPTFGEAWTRAQCAGILPMPGVILTIAEYGKSQPVGFSLHRTIGDEAELLLLAVNPQAQRCGIGRLLLKRFETDAIGAGARQVHLEVRENNEALAMYRTAGFLPVGRRKDYYSGHYGDRFDALTFLKELATSNS